MTFGRTIAPATALWIVAGLLLFGGAVAASQLIEPQIAAERELRYEAETSLQQDSAVLARGVTLRGAQARDAALLGRLQIDGDPATIVAAFVTDLSRLAAATHVTVIALGAAATTAATPAPPAAPRPDASAPARPGTDALTSSKLSLKLEGRYGDLLAAMRAFSAIDVLAEVDVAALERLRGGRLSASLDVTLYRRAPPALRPADPRRPRADVPARPT